MTYLWKYGDSLWNILRLNKSLTMWSRTTAILMNNSMIFFFDPCIILRATPFVFLDSCRISHTTPNALGNARRAPLLGKKAPGPTWPMSCVKGRGKGAWETPSMSRYRNPAPGNLLSKLRNGSDFVIPHHPIHCNLLCASINQ